MEYHFVQKHISRAFKTLGASTGKHPFFYVLVPLLLAAALSVRICWVSLTKEIEYLYSPINGRSIKDRDAIESLFPATTNGLEIITLTRLRTMATVLIEAKDGKTILRDDIIKEAIRIDNIIHNISFVEGNKNYTYSNLCLKQYSGECQSNDILKLREKFEDIQRKRLLFKYPANTDPFSQHIRYYGMSLGGVTTDENDYIIDAKALRLLYLLNHTTEEKHIASLRWKKFFTEIVPKIKTESSKLNIATSESIDSELSKITEMTLPLLPVTSFIMVAFAILSCMTKNWVTSKPWIAIVGCISPVLGIAVAFGLLLLCGVQYVDLNIIIFFLSIGIGLDDSFVILAAWRRTDSKKEVYIRMSQTYEDAAVSITITSVTNVLSLCVGLTIRYRIVQIFCTYAAVSMFVAYVYQITFFGGLLALSGYREKRNMHPLLCITIKNEYESNLLKHLYIGCNNKNNGNRSNDYKPTVMESFLNLITTVYGKVIVIVIFLLYITTSAYCVKFVTESFDYTDAMPSYSYLKRYMNLHYKYFVQYPHSIHIVINKTLDYSDKEVQKDIENIMENFNNDPDMADNDFTLSWLKYYLQSTKKKLLHLSYNGYNISQPNDFIEALKNVFLKLPIARSFRQHIRFNENETQIVASRFIIFSKNIDSSKKERRLISTLWRKADSYKYPIYVYNIWFPIYNILTDIISSCLGTMCTAAVVVTLVFIIFIPHLLCIIGIAVTIISIQIGVIGYMSLWNVPFDPISMICIITSIGLSVDYAAHISYAYLSCKEENSNEKIKMALRKTTYPIIQGSVSTLLGVVIFVLGPSKLFLIFFKVVTLVMLIAIFHGLFVIPVMLNILEVTWKILNKPCNKNSQRRQVTYYNNNETKGSLVDNIDDEHTSCRYK